MSVDTYFVWIGVYDAGYNDQFVWIGNGETVTAELWESSPWHGTIAEPKDCAYLRNATRIQPSKCDRETLFMCEAHLN